MSPRQDLYTLSPWMNAAGTLGFAPGRFWSWPEPAGAFVTNPVSLNPRTPARDRGAAPTPAGVVLHSGLPNPGLRSVLRENAAQWARSEAPVWLHLIASHPNEVKEMVRLIEQSQAEVMALELGLPPGSRSDHALSLVQAAAGELPVVAAVSLTAAGEPWLNRLARAGASAITLSPPRGMVRNEAGKIQAGRLLGPAVLPLAAAAVNAARRCGLPVIAGGGVYSLSDGQMLLELGATAVQIDAVLWNETFSAQNDGAA